MGAMRFVAGCAALAFASAAVAADKPCTKADAAAAEKALDRVVSWGQLNTAWRDFRHCDKDAIGELYTDALLRLIVQWKDIETAAAAMQKDAQYRDFVYAHLKTPAAKDDLEAVYSRTKSNCPAGLEAFCAELAGVVKPPS